MLHKCKTDKIRPTSIWPLTKAHCIMCILWTKYMCIMHNNAAYHRSLRWHLRHASDLTHPGRVRLWYTFSRNVAFLCGPSLGLPVPPSQLVDFVCACWPVGHCWETLCPTFSSTGFLVGKIACIHERLWLTKSGWLNDDYCSPHQRPIARRLLSLWKNPVAVYGRFELCLWVDWLLTTDDNSWKSNSA